MQVDGDWQVVWGPQRNVRQIDELPDALRRENLVAGFEYYVQPSRPYRLSARVVPQKTRTSVEQEYQVTVGAHQMQLLAKLKYNVPRGKTADIENRPAGLDRSTLSARRPGSIRTLPWRPTGPVCSIPLAQPAAGPFDITLRAHQPLTGAESELSFEVPRPHADTVGQAIVAVLPADNVELSPRAEAMVGLAQSLRPPIKLPATTARSLVLSRRRGPTLGSSPASSFTNRRFRPTC